MSAATSKAGDAETIALSAGDLRLAIAPAIGGVAIGFWAETPNGLRHFLRPSPQAAHALGSALYPLAPFAGRVAEARFRDPDLGEVRLAPNFAPEPHAIHGVGWTAPWRCEKKTKSMAVLTLDWPGASRGDDAASGWPWRFSAGLSYALDKEGLTIALSLRNDDASPFFSGLGLHPFFPDPQNAVILLEADGKLENGRNGLPISLGAPQQELDALKTGARAAPGWDNAFTAKSPALIAWPDRRLVLHALERVDGAEDDQVGETRPAEWWVVFTPADEDFFCVEPLTHQPDAHNGARAFVGDHGLKRLRPGETHHLFARISTKVSA